MMSEWLRNNTKYQAHKEKSDRVFRKLIFGGKYNIYPILLSIFSPPLNQKDNQNDQPRLSNKPNVKEVGHGQSKGNMD